MMNKENTMSIEIERERLERMLMLLAVATFHTPALQAERTELVEAGLKALAAPVQEPVAWLDPEGDDYCNVITESWKRKMQAGPTRLEQGYAAKHTVPVYTTPPAAQRQWVGIDYAWPTVADYEKEVGFEVNDAFKAGWNMARTTNDLFTQKEKNT